MTSSLARPAGGREPSSVCVLLALLLLGGCVRGSLPATELYRLAQPDTLAEPPLRLDGSTGVSGSLAVAPFATPGLYADDHIVYRIGELEYGQYPSRLWALPLSQMLGLVAEAELTRRPITIGTVLYDPPDRDRFDYVWQGTVREFEEVNRGDSVFAAVRFDARLMRSTDDSLLWSGSARLERHVPRPSMPAIVAELSTLAAEVIGRLADASRSELSRRAAATVPPSR